MKDTITPDLYGDLVDVASNPGFRDWLGMVRSTGGCADPIHLWGQSTTVHGLTGEILCQRPTGNLLVACGNRRATRCPSCSETYRADTYQLIRAGLVGGKGVTEDVGDRPKLFVTLTAPSFGPVHQRVVRRDGRAERCHPFGTPRCGRRHEEHDPNIGQPLDPDSYEYVGAVMWNALATKLWARTVQLVNRHAARLLAIPQRNWPSVGRVSVAKVAEYQSRGVVHFHAVFRLDGSGQGDPPPAGATLEVLVEAVRHAVFTARISPPRCSALDGAAPVVWGQQLDIKPIGAGREPTGLTDAQVAGYVAKYATKGADASGTVDRPLACPSCGGTGRVGLDTGQAACCRDCGGTGGRDRIDSLSIPTHAKRMIDTCWRLGGERELLHLRLRPWAHMLGFRGHFATKSRRYSVTLGGLRSVRRRWAQQRMLAAHGLNPETPTIRLHAKKLDDSGRADEEVVLVIGSWAYAGRGHSPGEAVFAASIREDAAASRAAARQAVREEAA